MNKVLSLLLGGVIVYYLYKSIEQKTPILPWGVIPGIRKTITDARGHTFYIDELTSEQINKIKEGWTVGILGQPAITPPGAIA